MIIGLKDLLRFPRMGHLPDDEVAVVTNYFHINNCKGLHEMITERFQPHFEIAEIGSFEGVSTVLFSRFVKKVYSIDCYDYIIPPTGRIPSMDDLFARAEKTFLARTKGLTNIVKIRKSSVEAAQEFPDQSLDAVYIDAEHDEASVRNDLRAWRSKVKKGGILSGHDWHLPQIQMVLASEGLLNGLSVYSDASWALLIK